MKDKTLKDMLEHGEITQEFYDWQVRANKQIREICKMVCKPGRCWKKEEPQTEKEQVTIPS